MPNEFEIEERAAGGWRRVVVSGELDLATAATFRRRLRRLTTEHMDVELDLSHLDFMDCCGLHVLTEAIDDARRDGRRLELAGDVSPQVERLFELVALRGLLDGIGTRRATTTPPLPTT